MQSTGTAALNADTLCPQPVARGLVCMAATCSTRERIIWAWLQQGGQQLVLQLLIAVPPGQVPRILQPQESRAGEQLRGCLRVPPQRVRVGVPMEEGRVVCYALRDVVPRQLPLGCSSRAGQ
jgi:hypothetical protein